jgi:hypothetical protein
MKKTGLFLVIILIFSQILIAQESRRDQRKIREKEKAAEISKLIDERSLRFIAQFAYPMSGGSIHLTSEYTLDIENEKVTAFLPFFGRAYYVEYGGRDGGIKFEVDEVDIEFRQDRRGHIALMEVKAAKDIYRLNLSVSSSGFATLDVGSVNRQSIRFSGIVVKLKPEDKME